MKRFITLTILAILGTLYAQNNEIIPNGINDQQKTTFLVKRPTESDRTNPGLVSLQQNSKLILVPNTWYVFEKQNDQVYWDNVQLSNLFLQMDRGYNLENDQIKSILLKYGIDSIVGVSMFPEMQNFYELYFPNESKDKIIEIANDFKQIEFVNFIEPVPVIKPFTCNPNDTYWSSQWGAATIWADSVYCYFTGTTRQRIGVIDNAVDYTHPDIDNFVQYGYDYVYSDADPSPDGAGMVFGHGTHVCGILAGDINNGTGVAGIINDTIYFAKTGDVSNNIVGSAVVNAINYITTNPRIRTYNMSIGFTSAFAGFQTAIDNSFSAGKLPIAAAGNSSSSTPSYPAGFNNVVSVSAIGVDALGYLDLAPYSNYGSTIDISAPGGENGTGWYIQSTLPGNTYGGAGWEGTSMAAPLVTGVAGLIFASNPFLTATQARNILLTQTFEMGTPGYDIYFGNGMTCAYCAFLEACTQMSVTISAAGSPNICTGGSVTLNAPYNFNVNYQWKKNGVNILGATSNSYVANQAGTYTLYVQSLAGCYLTTNSIVVTIVPNPVSNYTYVVTGNSVNFTNTSTGATSYSWNFGDAGTSTATNPSHTYAAPGPYNVTLTATNACGSSTITKVVNILNTAGYDELGDLSMSIFPNPTSDFVSISYDTEKTHDLSILIYNSLGQSMNNIFRKNISGQITQQIDMKEFESGIYFISINLSGQNYIYKIVKN